MHMDETYNSLGQYNLVPGIPSFQAAHQVSVPQIPAYRSSYEVQPFPMRSTDFHSYTAPGIPASTSPYAQALVIAGNLGAAPGYTAAPTSGIYTGVGGGNGVYSFSGTSGATGCGNPF